MVREFNINKFTAYISFFLLIFIHICWLYSSIKWTDKWSFIISFYLAFIPILLILIRYVKRATFAVLIGIFVGVTSNFIALLTSYAINRPERLQVFFDNLNFTWFSVKFNFIFFPTITGAWLIGGILAFIFHKIISLKK